MNKTELKNNKCQKKQMSIPRRESTAVECVSWHLIRHLWPPHITIKHNRLLKNLQERGTMSPHKAVELVGKYTCISSNSK